MTETPDTTPRRARRQAGTQSGPGIKPRLLVAGGGMVGLSLALALDHESGGAFEITVVDPQGLGTRRGDGRASAIAAGARRMLEHLGAWPNDGLTQPILDMVVTDSRVEDGARPAFLTFAGEAAPGEPFAHMVENDDVLSAVAAAVKTKAINIVAAQVSGSDRTSAGARAILSDGSEVKADLILGCDGGRSRLRQEAGIAMLGWDYDQAGIVATIRHEEPHLGRAEEHFLPAGPFAVLPLRDDGQGRHRSSLVWTEKRAEAKRLVALPDEEFHAALMERLGWHLGAVELTGPRGAYPLAMKLARRFIDERLALVGDAAHLIHPIAGQGLNMGFRDVAALTEILVSAWRLGEDIGALTTLERYERWRRFDTLAMGFATDSLNRLFSNDISPVRALRDLGLGIVDRLPRLKSFFISNAAGLIGEVPKLLRGQAV